MEQSLAKIEDSPINKTQSLDYAIAKFSAMQKVASMLMKATGFLPQHLKTPEQVMAVMIKSKELNIPMMEGLSSLFPVNGKVAMLTSMMNALVRRSGEMENYRSWFSEDGMTAYVEVQRRGYQPITKTFSMDEARRADLLKKDNWKYYPKDCLLARAQSRAFREVFPDVLGGMVYTPDELDVPTVMSEDGDEAVTTEEFFDEESTFSRLIDELIRMNKKRVDKVEYERFLELNKEDIAKLSDKKKDLVRNEYARGVSRFILRNKPDGTVEHSNNSEPVREQGTDTGGSGAVETPNSGSETRLQDGV